MISFRRSEDRGHVDHGWLKAKHSFSFGGYYDPEFMGFGPLRVINEDRVKANTGFPEHGHREMEIITYMISGEVHHRDTLGNGSFIKGGDIQRMTAGSGIRHSEFAGGEDVHLLQIWIEPETAGLQPSYEEKPLDGNVEKNVWTLIGNREGTNGAVKIHQDISLLASKLDAGNALSYSVDDKRKLWLQVIAGELKLGDEVMKAGDAAAIEDERELLVVAREDSEAILFDMVA